MAGAYTSINNVDSSKERHIYDAVVKVMRSYGDTCNENDEILVQPMVSNISIHHQTIVAGMIAMRPIRHPGR